MAGKILTCDRDARAMYFVVPWGTFEKIQHTKNIMRLSSNRAWLIYAAQTIEDKLKHEKQINDACR